MKITDVDDYRDYLKWLFEQKKLKNSKTSFQSFAKKVGVTKSYLKMVIDKKRHTSVDNFLSIADYFELPDDIIQYTVVLILKTTARNRRTKNHFDSILKNLAIDRNPQTISNEINNVIQYDILHLALLNALQMHNSKIDLNTLQNILGGPDIISIDEIKSSIDILIKNKLITIDKAGNFSLAQTTFFDDPSAWDDDGWKRLTAGLNRVQTALNWVGKSDLHNPCRHHMYSLGLSNQNVDKLIGLFDELKREIELIASDKQKVERLIFISNNVFAISKRQL